MNCETINDILRQSFFDDWVCNKIDRSLETYLLGTTFLYPNSDCIDLIVEVRNNDFIITDNGDLYLFLLSHGFELNEVRTFNLNAIAERFGVNYIDHEFITEAESYNFSLKVNLLAQAIQEAASMVHLIREYSRTDFKKLVINTFKSYKANVYPDFLVRGYKMDHVIDMRLNGKDEVLSKTISETTSYRIQISIERSWYAFNDIHKTDRKFKPVIIYDDSTDEHEEAWSEKHFNQLSAEGISAIGITANRNDIEQLALDHRM